MDTDEDKGILHLCQFSKCISIILYPITCLNRMKSHTVWSSLHWENAFVKVAFNNVM